MYENKIITEPKWKSWIIETNSPLLTPEQCKMVIDCGKKQPPQKAKVGSGNKDGSYDTQKRITTISWIPFNELPQLYQTLDTFIQKANLNHFGFDDVRITEQAQFTEYPVGGFYDWHMDSDVIGINEPPVRKISMTLVLSPDGDFEGGGLELARPGQIMRPKQGHAVFFASFVMHRVVPVTKGLRKSLVMWFGGEPFK